MDFQRFGIDPRLAHAAEGLETSFFFYEKMLALAVEKEENVCAKIALDAGREEVILLPALQWLLGSEDRRLLVAAIDEPSADRFAKAIDRLGAVAGLGLCRARSRDTGEVALEGETRARVLLGQPALLVGSGLDLRDYGFLVLDGVDKFAERSVDSIRKFAAALLPAWERRSILVCDKLSLKAKNLAWDLADNPAELSVEGESAKAESVRKETWSVSGDSKMKFLLGLLGREPSPRVCVFCNLRDSAEELAKRLAANGVSSDYILGALAIDRKRAVLEKVRSGSCRCLVLTDQGAEGLEPGAFPLVVNFDIPLEPELFVKRLEMLDREADGAKLVSMACERYVYGLAAVESYIDAKLDAAPIDEAMLAPEDRSEGMSFGKRKPQGQSQGREGSGRGGDLRRAEGRRQDSRPQQQRGGRGHSRDERSRGGDRSPDIRKSISEATGGTLDMSSAAASSGKEPRGQSRQPAPQRQQQKPKQRGQTPQGGQTPQTRKGGQQRRPAEQAGRGNGRGQENRQGNPYELPIEERMKLYREKYGQSLGGDAKQGEPRAEVARRSPAARPEKKAVPTGESREERRDDAQSLGDQESPGVIGRIFGAFKKKGDKA
jgi:Superfamily II DNA and RNA helicases